MEDKGGPFARMSLAGIALLAFPPILMTAQAAYVAIEVTYPLACACLLTGVAGTVLSSNEPVRR